jgi:hypothetical protein
MGRRSVRFRILVSIEVDAPSDDHAFENAVKLSKLLKNPLLRMQLEAEGIRLVGADGPVVHAPQREFV